MDSKRTIFDALADGGEITIGDAYAPAMEITEQTDADAYFEALVGRCMAKWGKTRDEAEQIERSNLGYYSGYYSYETAQRVNSLFGAVHPIFGMSIPTPEEAFNAGKKAGGS